MFLGTGIIFLICRYCKIHFASKNQQDCFTVYPTRDSNCITFLVLIFMNMKDGEILIPGAQGIGFMALAICLFHHCPY